VIDRESLDSESFIAGQNAVLEQIATGVSLFNVLTQLVQLIEAQTDEMFCSVLLLDEDRLHLRHGAAPSLPESYVEAIDGSAIGPNTGSCGTAAYFAKVVVVTDILTDPLWEDYRELAVRHGLRACWSTPILSPRAEVFGTFAMYYRVPRGPRPEEERLMQAATHIASIAIENWRAHESLFKSEERYRALVSASSQDVWRTNERGEAFFVTTAWQEMTGQSFDEIKGFGWLDAVHPEDRPGCIAAWKKAEQERSWYENEFRVRARDGTYRTFQCRGVPILRDDGSIREWVGANTDITERRLAQDALLERERELKASNAKIRELARKLMTAQEEERRHISLELHDDFNQQMAILSIMMSQITHKVPPEAESLRSELDKVQRLSVEITESIRRLSHELHPLARTSGSCVGIKKVCDRV
jgi:PAS domain S-box-containing protein